MKPIYRSIGVLIRERRMSLGLSLERLAVMAGCAKSYLSAIENERRRRPPGSGLLERLEEVLSFDRGELLKRAAWERTPDEVREEMAELRTRDRVAQRLVDLVSHLSGERAVGRSLDSIYKSGELRRLVDGATGEGSGGERGALPLAAVSEALPAQVPLINSVAAGYPTEFTDLGYPARVADEYVRAPDLGDPDMFGARVVGESMLPEYREGDVVVFSPARPVRSGMDCFVRLEPDHESTFKRVFFQSSEDGTARDAEGGGGEGVWIRLQPLNRAFPSRVVHREQVAGLYAAVSVTRAIG